MESLRRLAPRLLEPSAATKALVAAAAVAAVQRYLLSFGTMTVTGVETHYTHYNNFKIYLHSFRHLLAGLDLYGRYPADHFDVFKYSPTFAALIAPFSVLPDWLGLLLWNLLNAGALAIALARLDVLPARSRALAGWFILPEALTSFQNSQVNVLLAALVLLAYVALEEERPRRAALFLVLAGYVKIYPAAAAVMAVLYPRRREFAVWALVWLLVLGAAPLLFASPALLADEYRSWARLLGSDASVYTGISVGGILHAWFHLDPPKAAVALVGAGVALLPLLRTRLHADPLFRLSFAASLLVWMVVFNHTAESATFAIAVPGVALAYFAGPRRGIDRVALGLTFLFTSMSPRFPRSWVYGFIDPYAIKAVPCVLVWGRTVWDLLTRREAAAPVLVASTRAP